MLPEIAADVLHFLTRQDLDKACGVSKWLDALNAQYCELGDLLSRTTLFRHHWKKLNDAIRNGAVQRIQFTGIDFTALRNDLLLVAVGCRGLRSLEVTNSFAPSDFVTDDLIRSSVAKGLLELCIYGNASDSPHIISEDAVMDGYFPASATPGIQPLSLKLNGFWLTDMFLGKFFERLRSRPVRPGILIVFGAMERSGLAAYAGYLEPGGMHPTYRFPSTDGDNKPYEVMVSQGSSCLRMWISHV